MAVESRLKAIERAARRPNVPAEVQELRVVNVMEFALGEQYLNL